MGFNFLQGHHEETVYFFTNESQGVLGTHLIYLGRMKDWVDLEATLILTRGTPGVGIQRLNHRAIMSYNQPREQFN